MAAQILIDEIEGKRDNEPNKVMLKGKLIVRESCGGRGEKKDDN